MQEKLENEEDIFAISCSKEVLLKEINVKVIFYLNNVQFYLQFYLFFKLKIVYCELYLKCAI